METNLSLDDQLCFALYSAGLAMNKTYRPLLGPLELTYPQYLVLLVLWENDRLTLSDIGSRLFLDSATLTPLLKRMEKAGLLVRKRDEADERAVILSLTERGRSLRERAGTVAAGIECAVGLGAEEVVALRNALGRLRTQLLENSQKN